MLNTCQNIVKWLSGSPLPFQCLLYHDHRLSSFCQDEIFPILAWDYTFFFLVLPPIGHFENSKNMVSLSCRLVGLLYIQPVPPSPWVGESSRSPDLAASGSGLYLVALSEWEHAQTGPVHTTTMHEGSCHRVGGRNWDLFFLLKVIDFQITSKKSIHTECELSSTCMHN